MKYLLVLILLFPFCAALKAQDDTYSEYTQSGKPAKTKYINDSWQDRFYFGGGIGFLMLSGNVLGSLPGPSLQPRFNFKEFANNSSLSLSSNISFALQFSNVGNYTSLYAPLLLEYNVGHRATQFADFPVGFSVGLGGEYLGANILGTRLRNWAGLVNASVRFSIGGRSYYITASTSGRGTSGIYTNYFSLGNIF